MMVQQRPLVEGILLVHSDGRLRDFCRECLKRNGVQAIEAADGLDALLIAASCEKPVDLFITDSEDARISGIDLTSMLQSISPQIRVVVLSGTDEKKREAAVSQISQVRKLCGAVAAQATKFVVTGR